MSSQEESSDCYHHLKHLIQTGDIDAVKKYIQDNHLTHAHYMEYTDSDLRHKSMNGETLWFNNTYAYPVVVAAKCGNVDILNYLLSIGFSNKFDFHTSAIPMLEACQHGHIAVVKVLIELHGVDVNAIHHVRITNQTALQEATSACQLEIVQYLLDMGASVDQASGDLTPLRMAVIHENGKILTALLDAGADIEGNDPTDTPFYRAVFFDKLENAKILYSKGANPETRGKEHCTPLEIAIKMPHYDMVRYLVVELNLPWEDNLGWGDNLSRCPLDLAYRHNRTPELKLLIDAGLSSREWSREVYIPNSVTRELNVYLEQTSSNPRTLKQMCCFKVRRLLGRNLSRGVDILPLPRPLIDFVKLTHIP